MTPPINEPVYEDFPLLLPSDVPQIFKACPEAAVASDVVMLVLMRDR
jgi:hypothetical protein